MTFQFKHALIGFAFALGWTLSCLAQTPPRAPVSDPVAPAAEQLPGIISGTVVDQSGAVVGGADVKLTSGSQSQEAVSSGDGEFSFAKVAPGAFQLTITAAGFAAQTTSGTLTSGETYIVPRVALSVATNVSEVQVSLTQTEVAEEEIKIEEKQRVLGAIPNFYVSYIADAAPLTSKQKFKLAWKTVIDPFTFVVVGGAAGD